MHVIPRLLASTTLVVLLPLICMPTHADEKPFPAALLAPSVTTLTPSDNWPTKWYHDLIASCPKPGQTATNGTSLAAQLGTTNNVSFELTAGRTELPRLRKMGRIGHDELVDFGAEAEYPTDRNRVALAHELNKRSYILHSLVWYSPAKGLGANFTKNTWVSIRLKKSLNLCLAANF